MKSGCFMKDRSFSRSPRITNLSVPIGVWRLAKCCAQPIRVAVFGGIRWCCFNKHAERLQSIESNLLNASFSSHRDLIELNNNLLSPVTVKRSSFNFNCCAETKNCFPNFDLDVFIVTHLDRSTREDIPFQRIVDTNVPESVCLKTRKKNIRFSSICSTDRPKLRFHQISVEMANVDQVQLNDNWNLGRITKFSSTFDRLTDILLC